MFLNDLNIINFILETKNYYLIWYTEDVTENEKILIENNKLNNFNCLEDIKVFIKENTENCNKSLKIVKYDIDSILIDIKNVNISNTTAILEFWNIMIDILNNLNIHIYEHEIYNKIYDKLFYAENLPSINTSNKKYKPIFDKNEIQDIYDLIIKYINILNKFL